MDVGVHYANFSHPGGAEALVPRLAETARIADQGGVALFTVMDHWFQVEDLGGPAEPMMEGYTTLGYLAAITDNLRLSLLVTGTTYRHPGLLAKIVTTLDVLSGGRAALGIGAAWYEREHLGLGVPFPPMKERFERLEETLQICRQMWSDDDGEFVGEHYRLAETEGRDYAEIQKTILSAVDPLTDVDGFVGSMEEYAALGIQLVTLMPGIGDPVAGTTGLCESVVPRLKQL